MKSHLPTGSCQSLYFQHAKKQWYEVESAVIEEIPFCIHINGHLLTTLMATPINLKALAVGFLRSEGFIADLNEIENFSFSEKGHCADIWLNHDIQQPQQRIRTTGCGGGTTFDNLDKANLPLPIDFRITPQQLYDLYQQLRSTEVLYPITRGVHASALCSPHDILLYSEDVGRHNTLDKLWGMALLDGIETKNRILTTTGRISSEMLGKAYKMGVPIVTSRTSPTSRTLALAETWHMTVIGYIRRDNLRVYTGRERIQ